MPDLPLPGQLIAGKYRAEGVLGRGGMGVVIAAEHLGLNRRVALKFLSSPNPDPLSLRRFLREARLAAQIESQHVARVLDAATLESGVPYIVMEHLRGQNLKQFLKQHQGLPVADSVDYLIQACDAVAEAHALGIVHRDLKPSNLFLSERVDGVPLIKVLDFGISKARVSEPWSGAETTSSDAILGSPRYMAPEQIRSSKNANARSDIWSLGAILYELLAGAPPYDAETLPGLLAAIVADAPLPLSARRSDIPPELEAAVRCCLEKQPERRFASVAALTRALSPFGSPGSSALSLRISRILGEGSSDGSIPAHAMAPAAPARPAAGQRLVLAAGLLLASGLTAAVLIARCSTPSPPAAANAESTPAALTDRTPKRADDAETARDRTSAAPTEHPSAFVSGPATQQVAAPSRPTLSKRPSVYHAPAIKAQPTPQLSVSAEAAAPPESAPPESVPPAPLEPSTPSTPATSATPPLAAPTAHPATPALNLPGVAPPTQATHPLDVFSDPQ